ncbi:hypothetical protein B0H16DRAFT_1721578 [Mycena metata]|uniref:Uncharacterized protein n=1 Tax=Mycena metata TaxID=1033252 RepID=A0AAD7J663_9AGAR|nr:hypothetical protein B0H16DRAFT_1721578 [Mycena metata]
MSGANGVYSSLVCKAADVDITKGRLIPPTAILRHAAHRSVIALVSLALNCLPYPHRNSSSRALPLSNRLQPHGSHLWPCIKSLLACANGTGDSQHLPTLRPGLPCALVSSLAVAVVSSLAALVWTTAGHLNSD